MRMVTGGGATRTERPANRESMSQKVNPNSLRSIRRSGSTQAWYAEGGYGTLWGRHLALWRWAQALLRKSVRFRSSNAPSLFRRKKPLFWTQKFWSKQYGDKSVLVPTMYAFPRGGAVWKYSPIMVKKARNQKKGVRSFARKQKSW